MNNSLKKGAGGEEARKIIFPSATKTKQFGEKSSSESVRTESIKLHKHYKHFNSETFAC